eukprot:NODE_8438_length_518_cov_3.300640_g7377_i0.p3 GENE.NODE_8438_length_518_cov_3.300640_g7377_i0~~NODE_8438_length_518_cov_3.300640_g7377_i0.p3  ORF type:complete len:90 (-),score=12.18 NODE_8438_length_518_cov_3.300640_g7377_i0:78-347(-)
MQELRGQLEQCQRRLQACVAAQRSAELEAQLQLQQREREVSSLAKFRRVGCGLLHGAVWVLVLNLLHAREPTAVARNPSGHSSLCLEAP